MIPLEERLRSTPKLHRTGQLPLRAVLCDFGCPRPPNESVPGKGERRRLAASWWVDVDDAPMDTLDERTFDEVLASCLTWRRWLVRQMGGFVPDVDAEITAAIWEQYVAGVTAVSYTHLTLPTNREG